MAAGLLEKRRVERVMGTAVSLAVPTGAPPTILDEVFAWLQWVDRTFSVHRPDSQVSRVGSGELSPGQAHRLVDEVLDRCAELFLETEGWFDAWPLGPAGKVDPSGYVKGWSIDVACALLAGAGIRDYCLAAGGDVRVAGWAGDGAPWRIGVQHPIDRQSVAAVIQASPLAVATSGAYERGAHIHGRRSERLLSATVAGPRLGMADALATALFAADGEAPWFARFRGYEYLTIGRDARVRWTPGLDARIAASLPAA
ncbi:MAG: FAD:protein FMN transferase [Acidimicrobiia bacterium]|jgi:thiamine biosynthesis lipoprotein|nr:FAD:protein FMN transferase [Acidimicrobiia bacterium]